MDEIKIIRFATSHTETWDNFVNSAKNSYFFFKRAYMEYHADRFQDYSLLIYIDNNLVALLPAHIQDGVLNSHRGLTFGGFILSEEIKAVKMHKVLCALKSYMQESQIKTLIYKAMPHIYHQQPCEEDLFALHKVGAKLVCRDITSAINLKRPLKIAKGRRSCIKKAQKEGLLVKESGNLQEYFAMIENLLQEKYQVKPVHNYQEMKLLMERFPENIKLYGSYRDGIMQAGVLTFVSDTVVKSQYISSTEEGRKLGAVDIIIDHLITEVYQDKEYFDFGTSTADTDIGFNESLMQQKELFGARAIAKDVYELESGI